MKKFVLMVVVMAIAAPAMADMVLTGTDNGDGSMTLSYISDVAPRGVAFKVTATGADITGARDQMAEFNANIDYLYANQEAGLGEGNALALDGGPGVFVSGNVAVISAGVLDTAGGQAAGPKDDGEVVPGPVALITIEFSGACTVAIEADTLRSETGAVGSNIPVNYTAVTAVAVTVAPTECFPNTDPGYANFVKVGAYAIMAGEDWDNTSAWCNRYQCVGDADGAYIGKDKDGGRIWVSADDLAIFAMGWQKVETDDDFPTFVAADYNHAYIGKDKDGARIHVSADDLGIFAAGWQVTDTAGSNYDPTTYPCPGTN